MRRRRPRPVGAGLRRLALAALIGCFAVACTGRDQAATTSFTVPPVTTAPTTTTTTTTEPPTTTTTVPPAPRARLAGISPGYGIGSLSPPEIDSALDAIAATGVRWLRLDFDWSVIQAGGPNEYDWSHVDPLVVGARGRHLAVIALVTYTPQWARPRGAPDKAPPSNPDDFARFVSTAAQRYRDLDVTTWEIWNEPNVSTFWYPRPNPEGYTALLMRASSAIRAVEPKATIITGGLAPASNNASGSQIEDRTFLTRVYNAGGAGFFDAVALHPYSFPHLPLFPADYNTFLTTPGLYQVMVQHGDAAKKIWATEIGAPTAGGGGAVSETEQSRILVQAFGQWTQWTFTGPMIWFSYADASADPYNRDAHFGLVDAQGAAKPSLAVFDSVVSGLIRRQQAG